MPTVEIKKERILRALNRDEKEVVDAMYNVISALDLEEKEDKWIIEFDPERFDFLSKEGIIRALKYYFGEKPKKYEIKKIDLVVDARDAPKYRPFIVGMVIKNLRLDDDDIRELMQFQEKICNTFGRRRKKVAVGFYKLDLITPPIYYKAEVPEKIKFVPLGFNYEMDGREILEYHPKGVEFGHLIKDYEKYPVLVDSKGKVLSMPPIINSDDLGKIDENTRDVFVDLTGTDLEALNFVASIIAVDFIDRGCNVYAVRVIYKDKEIWMPELKYRKMKIEYEKINKLLGLKLSKEKINNLLERMGYIIEEDSALIPPYRVDIRSYMDLAEDVGKAYGYDNIPRKLPKEYSIGEIGVRNKVRREIEEILIGLGFFEVMTPGLVNKDMQTTWMRMEKDVIEILNAKESGLNSVRSWLLPNILQSISINKGEEKPLKIFEVGPVVIPDSTQENLSRTELHLGIGIYGKDADFTKIRQVIEYLLERFKKKVIFKEFDHPSFIPGRCAKIIFHGEEVGFLGEIHPEVLNNFDLEYPVAAAEIDLERLFHF